MDQTSSWAERVILPLLLVGSVIFIITLADGYLRPSAFTLFLATILTSTYLRGRLAGLWATALSLLGAVYLSTTGTGLSGSAEERLQGIIFGFVGVLISVVIPVRRPKGESLLDLPGQYQIFFARNPSPMWIFDSDSLQILDVNQSAIEHYGYSREEFLSMDITALRPPEEVPRLHEKLKGLPQTLAITGPWWHRRKDGALIEVELVTQEIRYGNRKARFVLVNDLTERRRTEAALSVSEHRFTAFMNYLPGFAFIKDRQGHYVYANEQLRSSMKMTSAAPGRTNRVQTIPSELAPLDAQADQQVIQEQQSVRLLERIVSGDTERHLLTVKFPLLQPDSQDALIGGIAIDVTDQIRAEQELAENRKLFQQISEASPDIIYLYDLQEKRNVYVSRAVHQILGFTREDVAQLHDQMLAQLLHPDDLARVNELNQGYDTLPDGAVSELEFRMRHVDGTYRWLRSRTQVFTRRADGRAQQILGIAQDVTRQKRIEDEKATLAATVEHERYRLKTLLASVPGVVWEAYGEPDEASQRINFISDYVEKMLGYTVDEWLSQPNFWLSIVHPEDRERAAQEGHAIFTSGGPGISRFRWITKTGAVIWVEAQSVAIRDEAGRPIGMRGVTLDISDRTRAEQALLESETRFRSVVDCDMLGIGFWHRDGKISFANHALLTMLGYGSEEVASGVLSWRDITPPEYDAVDARAMQEVLATGRATPFEKEYLKKDGRRVPVLVGAGLFQGARESGAFFALDISARKEAERKLQSEIAFRKAIETSVPSGIAVIGLDGRQSYVNPAFSRMVGWSEEELLGATPPFVYWPPEERDRIDQAFAATLNGQAPPGGFELPLQRKNGDRFETLLQISPLLDDRGQTAGWLAAITDITERRKAEKERELLLARAQVARAEAEHANRLKDEFLAIVSHELRTPLNAIIGWSTLLRERSVDAATTAVALETIERNAKAQAQIVNDILDVSRIITGKLVLNTQPVSMATVIKQTIDTIRPTAAVKEIQLETVMQHGSALVSGDPDRLQQIFWNLLANAVKFTDRGGRISIWLELVHGKIRISITDTGCGIKPEFLPYIFDRFRQADSSHTRLYGGLGLGLAIARYLVELHGGTIEAESPGEGLGATFTVYLPVLSMQESSEPPATYSRPNQLLLTNWAADGSNLILAGVRVLIIEDDPDTSGLLTWVLESAGAEVKAATTAPEGFNLVQTWRPTVLVSDISLQGEDGYALMRRIRTLPADQGGRIPAAALTAHARPEDRVRALTSGYHSHITKPFDPPELLAVVASLAGRMAVEH